MNIDPASRSATSALQALHPERSAAMDRLAIALASLCVVHCLALPLASVVLPLAGVVAEAEWIHIVLVFVTVGLAAAVVALSQSGRSLRFSLPAGIGSLCLIGALFAERWGVDETLPTVVGAVLVALGHVLRARFVHSRDECP